METVVGFTRISNRTAFAFDPHASKELGEEYWRVCVPFRYYVGTKDSDRWVDVSRGFLSNGADIPRLLWSILPRHGEYDQAVALHDYLCEHPYLMTPTGPIKITREEVDQIFYEALDVLQVASWKLQLIRIGTAVYRIANLGRFKPVNLAKVHLQTDPDILNAFFSGFVLKPVL